MIRLGRRPNSSGGMSDPRRLLAPLPGIKDALLLPTGVDSLITSILGASGALISGNFGYKIRFFPKSSSKHVARKKNHLCTSPNCKSGSSSEGIEQASKKALK